MVYFGSFRFFGSTLGYYGILQQYFILWSAWGVIFVLQATADKYKLLKFRKDCIRLLQVTTGYFRLLQFLMVTLCSFRLIQASTNYYPSPFEPFTRIAPAKITFVTDC